MTPTKKPNLTVFESSSAEIVDKDVIFRGKLENSGRKVLSDEREFWCVWKNENLVGKVQNGEKVHFRIQDLTTMTFKVTRIPIDRKLKFENGRYMQLFFLYRDSILNLAIVDSGIEESLVFLEFDLNTYQTTFHPSILMSRRTFAQEMTPQNTVLWGDYFFFVRKVLLEADQRKIYAEVYRYNLVRKGKFRCISQLPDVAGFPEGFMEVTYDAIASDRTGIVLFGVRTPHAPPFSEKVALLDTRRNRWTIFPQRRNRKTFTPCATLEKITVAESGGDILYVKRTQELELWQSNMFSRQSKFVTKISALYVEMVHRISRNNILIVTRMNDQFFLIRKSQEAPLSLRQLSADVLRRYNLHKPSNAELKAQGINRKFFNMLIK